MRSIAVNAAKGQSRAQRLFAELLAATEQANRALHNEWLEAAITYKVEWERELDRRARLGITDLPAPLPHPDHVVVDIRSGTARIIGPATKEEQAEWQMWHDRKADFEDELAELEGMLANEYDPKMRAILVDDIAQTKRVIDIIERGLTGLPTRG